MVVHYDGWLMDGQKFDSSRDREQPFEFKLGIGQVIEGWDLAVASMIPGEIATFTVRADYAYGWEGKPPKIPIDATLRFEIELISWRSGTKPVGDMSAAEKRAHGLEKRQRGTKLLKSGKYEAAAEAFEAGVESLGSLHAMMSSGAPDPAKLAEVFDALRSCLLNLSQCKLKLSQWEDAIAICSRVLVLPGEGDNVKARFRRGVGLVGLERYAEAKEELKAACLLDPKNKEIREQYEAAKNALAAQKALERSRFGGMFAEGPKEDGPVLEDESGLVLEDNSEQNQAQQASAVGGWGGKPFVV